MTQSRRRTLVGCCVILIILLLDQASKYWILYGLKLSEGDSIAVFPCLNFTMVWNRAVTFGMFAGHKPVVFVVISLTAIVALGCVLERTKSLLVSIACGGIIGGALGNVIDRLAYGKVVDFLDFYISSWHWYVFNIADSAIVCGVGLWMLEAFLSER